MPSSKRRYSTSTGCRTPSTAISTPPSSARPEVPGPHQRHAQRLGQQRCSNQALSLSPAVSTAIRGVPSHAGGAAPARPARSTADGVPRIRPRRPSGSAGSGGAGAVPVGQRVPEAGGHPQVVGGDDPLAVRRPHARRRRPPSPAAGRARPARRRPGRGPGCARPPTPGSTPARTISGARSTSPAPPPGRAVGVGQEGVQRPVPLLHAGGDPRPLARQARPGQRVQRERLARSAGRRTSGRRSRRGPPRSAASARGRGQPREPQPLERRRQDGVVVAQPAVRGRPPRRRWDAG